MLRHRSHAIEHRDAVAVGRRRAERDERVHVRRAMQQPRDAAAEKFSVDDQNCRREQKLRQPLRHGVFGQRRRERPAPHAVPHGEIHQRQQQRQRAEQAREQSLALALFGALRSARLRRRPLPACAVARCADGLDNGLRRGVALDRHGVRQQADRAGVHARNGLDGLFHTCAARRAAHSGHIKLLFHDFASISSCAEASASARRSPSRPRHGCPRSRRCGYAPPAAPG